MSDIPSPLPPAMPLLSCDQAAVDASHLKILIICHYIVAGLSFISLPAICLHYYLFNTFVVSDAFAEVSEGQMTPFLEMWAIFKWMYLLVGLMALIDGLANLFSGLYMQRRKNRLFSLVVAGCNCLSVPLGTILGVFTLVVLCRNSVSKLYESRRVRKA